MSVASGRPQSLPELARWAEDDADAARSGLRELVERARLRNPELHALISFPDDADGSWPPPPAGPLAGTALAVKDNIDAAGFVTTCGTAFSRHEPDADAPPLRLLRAAGATVIGKANMGELAIDVGSQNQTFGGASNPWDVERTPGGSSGGSAVAVAAGLVDLALGTDAGGSVRIPAALCGLAGYRPTGGRWGTAGIAGTPWSVDSCGLIGRSVDDLVWALDGASLLEPERAPVALGSLRVGFLDDDSMGVSDPAVWQQYRRAIDALADAGLSLTPLSLPGLTDVAYACAVLGFAEMAYWQLEALEENAPFGDGIRGPLELGASFRAVDYLIAQRLRGELADRYRRSTDGHDLVLTPTVPTTAPLKGETPVIAGDDEESALFAYIRFTALANVIDVPSLTVAAGLVDGLPVGLQVVGRLDADAALLDAGREIDDAMRRAFGTDRQLAEVSARYV